MPAYVVASKPSLVFRLHEKGGKRNDVIAHHKAEAYLDAYLDAAGIRSEGKSPLFRSIPRHSTELSAKPLSRTDALRMVYRRAKAAGLDTRVCNHTFRATGITNYLEQGGKLDVAQEMAGHESSRTTGLYDRREGKVTIPAAVMLQTQVRKLVVQHETHCHQEDLVDKCVGVGLGRIRPSRLREFRRPSSRGFSCELLNRPPPKELHRHSRFWILDRLNETQGLFSRRLVGPLRSPHLPIPGIRYVLSRTTTAPGDRACHSWRRAALRSVSCTACLSRVALLPTYLGRPIRVHMPALSLRSPYKPRIRTAPTPSRRRLLA
jgi:hypothetical protein